MTADRYLPVINLVSVISDSTDQGDQVNQLLALASNCASKVRTSVN